MSYTTYNQLVNGLANSKIVRVPFSRQPNGTPTANQPHSLWQGAASVQIPGVGALPATGVGNGTTVTSSTVGAIVPPANAYLVGMEGFTHTANSGVGTLYLLRRICHIQINHAQATSALTGLDATGALDAGQGGQIMIEVGTGLSAAANVFNLTYTDQGATGSRVTPNITTVASTGQGKSVNTAFFQPLRTGDNGVRSIESITAISGAGTGTMVISIVKPLAALYFGSASSAGVTETVFSPEALLSLPSTAALQLMWLPTTTAGGTISGSVNFITD